MRGGRCRPASALCRCAFACIRFCGDGIGGAGGCAVGGRSEDGQALGFCGAAGPDKLTGLAFPAGGCSVGAGGVGAFSPCGETGRSFGYGISLRETAVCAFFSFMSNRRKRSFGDGAPGRVCFCGAAPCGARLRAGFGASAGAAPGSGCSICATERGLLLRGDACGPSIGSRPGVCFSRMAGRFSRCRSWGCTGSGRSLGAISRSRISICWACCSLSVCCRIL